MKINNNIQESYCSYPVSKLLKEKGAVLQSHYCSDSKCVLWYHMITKELHTWKYFASFNKMLNAPTHALAIEWIKQNYGSDKIKHITYDWTSEQIDNELKFILEDL